MSVEVQNRDYGVFIVDEDTFEGLAVATEDIPKLIKDLQERLPLEINFNTIVYQSIEEGALTHTYSSDCPPGCYGQLDECHFKQVEEVTPILPPCPVSESCYIWTPHLHGGVVVTPGEEKS